MITVTIINCTPKLEAMGIFMGERGSYGQLCTAVSEVVTFDNLEYWYQEEMIKLFLPSDTEVPDLSAFGEVENIDYGEQ
jgi:hypothetical protein